MNPNQVNNDPKQTPPKGPSDSRAPDNGVQKSDAKQPDLREDQRRQAPDGRNAPRGPN